MTQKDEYNYILEKVFNRVKDRERGVLFECIETLVDQKHATKIIKQFNIQKSNTHSEDFRVLEKISFFNPISKAISLIVSNPVSSSIHGISMHFLSFISDRTKSIDTETQVSNVESSNPINDHWSQARYFFTHISPTAAILAIAIVIIGLSFIGQSKKNSSGTRKANRQQGGKNLSLGMRDDHDSSQEENDTIFQQVLEADLCLVIPCNCIASDLHNQMDKGKELSADDTITLVDNSAYFLVAKSREEPMFQLDKNFEKFPEDRYLFIRLRISDERDLTKIDLQGSLSQAIRSQKPMVIQEIGLRQDFSNLQEFHRA